jgi:deoxyribodipyrimidine photo-lyase
VTVALVVFTRDLRVADHLALATAADAAAHVVPLFVFDDTILASRFNRPNRTGFLLDSVVDLDRALRSLGARLVVRRGRWVDEVIRTAAEVGAGAVHLSADYSKYAQDRECALARACRAARIQLDLHSGTAVVPPGAVTPAAADHYRVFTPYYRRWIAAPRRAVAAAPPRIALPPGVEFGSVPTLDDIVQGVRAPGVARGGRSEARRRLDEWMGQVGEYDARHDDLGADATSHLSADLHFGCLSPLEVVEACSALPGAAGFIRQLCWRDFFVQLLAARPDAAWSDYRSRGNEWRDDPDALDAWREGRTGYPVVDAAMRQLTREGFVHNRARMIAASFLTKDLSVDWRHGARHFLDHLVDGDIANNNLNWQWVAGTGTDSNPYRVFNPTTQGKRFDPDGEYVRRYVPELAALRGATTHDPDTATRRAYGYPDPIVDHRAAITAYQARLTPKRRH